MVKVGDLVEVVGNASSPYGAGIRHSFDIGEVVRVLMVDEEGDVLAQRLKLREGECWLLDQYVDGQHIKLVEEIMPGGQLIEITGNALGEDVDGIMRHHFAVGDIVRVVEFDFVIRDTSYIYAKRLDGLFQYVHPSLCKPINPNKEGENGK